jgi:hypothetical protein
MNDALWHTEQQTRTLQLFLEDVRGVWFDENSRRTHTRLLEPHQSDTTNMLQYFHQQEDSLAIATVKLKDAAAALVQAQIAETNVHLNIGYTEEEMQTSAHEYELYAQYNNLARLDIPLVYALIEKAFQAGGE